jgi:hypothetical protein
MTIQNGATTLAEEKYEYKTDVNLIFGNKRVERTDVLRTTLHSLPVWKTRNPNVGLSPFKDRTSTVTKDASVIDGEMWVFGVNATQAQDIAAAIKIASNYYNIKPSVLLADIYAKNLNAEGEHEMSNQALVRANKDLYSTVCKALIGAAKQLGVSNQFNFYVFSKNNNTKIPQPELASALREGGASSVNTDEHRPRVTVGDNTGKLYIQQFSNLHLATLKA